MADILLTLEQMANLRDALADYFDTPRAARMVADDAGMRLRMINMDGPTLFVWADILRQAKRDGSMASLLRAAQAQAPDNTTILSALRGDLPAVRGPDIAREIEWRGTQEVITGTRPTFVPVAYFERGLKAARSVGRIITRAGGPGTPATSMGTGVLIANNLLLTNHHVFPDIGTARFSSVQFDFQTDGDGLNKTPVEYALEPDGCYESNVKNDWAIVRVPEDATRTYGSIPVTNLRANVGDFVSVIHHPSGGMKVATIRNNQTLYSDGHVLQYLSDTEPGSSGAPVFNDCWMLVGLHHSGGWMRDPNDGADRLRNEGIASEVILADLSQKGLLPQ